ncbi:MAG: VOC family protein, partial [Phenylobacterium sp.]|uniref:VOC family protein n=1 Tax=Phenylobacterium sp. TaxID=1871053 RepID=UPI001A6049E4
VRDFDAACGGYRRLLGREPELQPGGGAKRAWFHLANMSLEVIAPDGDGHPGAPVKQYLDEAGEGLWLAAFAVDDVAATTKLFERRGLSVEPMGEFTRIHAAGLRFVLWPQRERAASPATSGEAAAVGALDHVVVQTPNADRAVGLYGAKFGLDLRLDRENAQWGARQLFFRCGAAVFEVGASLKHPPSDAPDKFGGLAWRVADPEALHARLAGEGFNVSDLRTGRKPGTRVFTVRAAPEGMTLGGVPTLVIQQDA